MATDWVKAISELFGVVFAVSRRKRMRRHLYKEISDNYQRVSRQIVACTSIAGLREGAPLRFNEQLDISFHSWNVYNSEDQRHVLFNELEEAPVVSRIYDKFTRIGNEALPGYAISRGREAIAEVEARLLDGALDGELFRKVSPPELWKYINDSTLRALSAAEKRQELDQETIKRLNRQGYIQVADVTHLQSPEPEFIYTDLTDRGWELLRHGGRSVRSSRGSSFDSRSGKKPWSSDQKIGFGVLIVEILSFIGIFTVPEVRRFVGLDKPEPTPQPKVEPRLTPSPPPPIGVVARTASDIVVLRRQNHVLPIGEPESDRTLSEIPPNSYAFAYAPAFTLIPVGKIQVSPVKGRLEFELHKLADGTILTVGFVGPETFSRLREGLPPGEILTVYSQS